MKAQVAALVAVFVLGGGGATTWWLMGDDEVARVEVDPDAGYEALQVRVAALPGAEEGPVDREVVAAGADASEAASADLARVRGRCIGDATGMPLAGFAVRFDGSASNDQLMALHADAPLWTDPEPTETDADGSFEVADLPPGRWLPFVAVGCEDFGCASWASAAEAIEVRSGERSQVVVEVPRRVLRAYAVDQDDRPVAGLSVTILPKAHLPGARSFERVTGADGSFVLDPAPGVPLRLLANRRDAGRIAEAEVDPAAGTVEEPVEVTLRVEAR